MNTLVICRLSDSRLRKTLYEKLKNRGFSPAQGIFECDFSQVELDRLQKYFRELPYNKNDCIILYTLCASCQKKRVAFGAVQEAGLEENWLIF